jgi:hypothetical protein
VQIRGFGPGIAVAVWTGVMFTPPASADVVTAAEDFSEPAPILVVTPDDRLAGCLFAALDQLTWPFMRAGGLVEASRLCGLHRFALLLVDVRLGAHSGPDNPRLPPELRGALNAETPALPIARADDGQRPDAILCYDGGIAAVAIADFIATELGRIAEARLLSTAQQVVAAPSSMSAVPIPPALEAAHRLDWMYAHEPSLENAAAVVGRHEHLAKHVVRLAHALSGDSDMRSWKLGRVLLHVGLLRFIPLVKIVAARSLFPVRDPGRRQTMDAIWRFSVARAVAMRWLAPRMQTHDPDTSWRLAFDAGLFADAGASLLVWLRDQSEPRRLRPLSRVILSPQLAAHHEWLGEGLLRRWKLRPSIGLVAGLHHLASDPDRAPVVTPGLGTLAIAAAAVVEDADVGADPTGPHLGQLAGLAFQQLSLSAADRQHVTSLVKVELDRIVEAAGR